MLKPNKIKLLLALCVISAGTWLTVTIVKKTHQPGGPVEVLKQLPKNVDISLQKIHYTDTRDGVKRWDLIAEKVEYDKSGDLTYFRDIRMEIFSGGKDNGGKMTLTAGKATYHNKTGDVAVEGAVTLRNETGMKFVSERLFYDSSRSLIHTRDFVRLVDGKLVVEGNGMQFLLKDKSVKILSNVTARIGMDDK